MNRRGFLATLFGGAVAAATLDPEQVLWKPGKLISIPRVLHVARSVHFGCVFELGVYEKGAFAEAIASYTADSLKRLEANIAEEVARTGRTPQFLPLPLPRGVDFTATGPLGSLSEARIVRVYDILRNVWIQRVDCLVRI